MNKNELSFLMDSITPKLWSFACALDPRESEPIKLVTDSYTVFLIKEKNFLLKEAYNLKNRDEKNSIRNYILKEMLKEIFELALKRIGTRRFGDISLREYSDFYSLKLKSRAVLFLKENLKMSSEEIQEIFLWKKHEVIESFYNATNELLKESGQSEEQRL